MQTQKQNYFIKTSEYQTSSPQNYFRKRERFNTFETEEMGQDEYLTIMKHSSLERKSPVLEKDIFDVEMQSKENFL